MKKIEFDQEQEAYIINNYKTKTQSELAKHIGVKKYTIAKWLKTHDLYKKKNMFSKDDILFMKENYDKMSYKEIGNVLGFTERQVRGKINHLGLSKNRKFNKHYFHNIDSATKAYFLGLIYADGWITYNIDNWYYEFGIELKSEDKYILDYLNRELGNQHIIKHFNPCKRIINGNMANVGHMDRLRVYSKDIVFDLEKHGIVLNKSTSDSYPNGIPNSYFFDFLRGYIDGDGCYYDNGHGKFLLHITCGNKKPLEWVQDELNKYNLRTSIYKEKDKKFRLVCSNISDMKRLINYMYYDDNIIFLVRKYKKIKSYINGFAA